MRLRDWLAVVLGCVFFVGCGDDDAPIPVDGGPPPDAGEEVDAAEPRALCTPESFAWQRARIDTVVDVSRSVDLFVQREACEDATIAFTSSTAGVVTPLEDAVMTAGTNLVEVTVTGASVGTTTLTATLTYRPGTPQEAVLTATMEVAVEDTTLPSCTGTASGNVAPGGSLRLGSTATGVEIPAGAATNPELPVTAFDGTIACGDSQVPEGFVALGPAVTFGPTHQRFVRDVPLTVPVKLALLPQDANVGQIFFSYTGPGVTTPRVVPVASPDFRSQPGFVTFQAPRLGTYQAITRAGGPSERDREFTFRGITGFSMGSGGAALIGTHNQDRFDFVGPLGGPVDWIHLLHYIRTYHLGGFCTEAQRLEDPEGCAGPARTDRTPPTNQLYEVRQDFEHWYYEDDWNGHGGTFDRKEYIKIFRDLAMMYGNANTTALLGATTPNVVPPGIPDSDRTRTDAERCASPYVIRPECGDTPNCVENRYYDDEYNPSGDHPVITFCDGAEVPADNGRGRDLGFWDPEGDNRAPVEVALAVDLNDNGIRDPGEPVIRAGQEPFQDCGLDQVCNEDEEGYDPVTNPDPAGDDYDFQYNPTGTEANWLRDYVGPATGDCDSPQPNVEAGMGERFADTGLDGVDGTPQLDAGGLDVGENDGCFTLARGLRHMYDNNPRSFVLTEEESTLRDLDFFGDGGIRDLFNFATNQDHLAGAFAARGLPINLYNGHASLAFNGHVADDDFRVANVDWDEIGKYVQVRYGQLDSNAGALAQGDGQHVGTPTQIVNRLLAAVAWMDARWPGGDRALYNDRTCAEVGPGCPNVNNFTIEFTSSLGRVGPASIVLPPGYFAPENADVRYPVVYLLHGYGQNPEDLLALGFIMWNLMRATTVPAHRRLQKMIFVFPDGRCRNGECVKGTFYADAPVGTPDGAQMETFMLDLMDHVDANYRTKRAEVHRVAE
ncbi:MAG: hypothetical protein H6721_11320 [Sandaracinus sp.]|nr:hypothetical protein [Sandaracinus sp.]MCB9612985.1 hypothetical protein [Sandaracinus sp.]MCB9619129.1 hypothetical protein [Sandaracinus sp.]MCB9632712.1 hypothetical protein [Sandaracinus sp.]